LPIEQHRVVPRHSNIRGPGSRSPLVHHGVSEVTNLAPYRCVRGCIERARRHGRPCQARRLMA